jgi:anti-sigma B factor antagonist
MLQTDEIVAVSLEGEFDMANAPALVEQIDQAILSDQHLIIDLSEATFIDTTVINALFYAAKTAKAQQRTVVLQLGTAPIVERVIEITEIDQVVPRVSTRADAVQIIKQGIT